MRPKKGDQVINVPPGYSVIISIVVEPRAEDDEYDKSEFADALERHGRHTDGGHDVE